MPHFESRKLWNLPWTIENAWQYKTVQNLPNMFLWPQHSIWIIQDIIYTQMEKWSCNRFNSLYGLCCSIFAFYNWNIAVAPVKKVLVNISSGFLPVLLLYFQASIISHNHFRPYFFHSTLNPIARKHILWNKHPSRSRWFIVSQFLFSSLQGRFGVW